MPYQKSETVELKSVVIDDIRKEIIAFANCDSGKLYIGVQDDGTIIGLDDPDNAALQISNLAFVRPKYSHHQSSRFPGNRPDRF